MPMVLIQCFSDTSISTRPSLRLATMPCTIIKIAYKLLSFFLHIMNVNLYNQEMGIQAVGYLKLI